MYISRVQKKLCDLDPALRGVFSQITRINFSPTHKEPYEVLITSIAHQMVHGKAAQACLDRLAQKTGKVYSAKKVVEGGVPLLRECGFSNNKARAILELAEKKIAKTLPTKKDLERMSNVEILKTLMPLRGVGKWTVEMYLIFSLGRMDIFPVDDFGVREGYRIWKKKRVQEKPKIFAKKASTWAPYRTVVALALWKLADTQNTYKK